MTLTEVYIQLQTQSHTLGWQVVQWPFDEKVYLEYVLALIDLSKRLARKKNIDGSSRAISWITIDKQIRKQVGITISTNGTYYFKGSPLLSFVKDRVEDIDISILPQTALADTLTEMARTTIALRRYRLRYGKYPEQLKDLVPEYLPTLPWDWYAEQPLRYRKKSNDRFLLWSVGDNGKDDGGSLRPRFSWIRDWTDALDLVWPPSPTKEVLKKYGLL